MKVKNEINEEIENNPKIHRLKINTLVRHNLDPTVNKLTIRMF